MNSHTRPQDLSSTLDDTMNFCFDDKTEARYVRRDKDKVLAYLSSHTGCRLACRFCHLTQTGQTDFESVTRHAYLDQAQYILDHYLEQQPAESINYNFMARGEVLENETIVTQAPRLFTELRELSQQYHLKPKFNLSTIMPVSFRDKDLADVLGVQEDIRIFYSAYSTRPEFRKRWLPNALPIKEALRKLSDYQQQNPAVITLHHALIKGENDSIEDLDNLHNEVVRAGLTSVKFNLVRYNPYSDKQGQEPDDKALEAYFRHAAKLFPHPRTRIVPRVGYDVYASCGMFAPATSFNASQTS